MATLDRYTRQIEECRRRWNQRTLEYVLESAGILQAARKEAGDERRWLRWVRKDARMNQSTAWRHIRVSTFIHRNYALKHNFVTLSISKVYALSKLERDVALKLARDSNVRQMSDLIFAQYVRPFLPKRRRRPTVPNLIRTVEASLTKAERAFERWPRARKTIPPEHRAKMISQLNRLLTLVTGLKGAKAAVV